MSKNNKNNLICGLDIGTNAVKVLVVSKGVHDDGGKEEGLEIVSQAEVLNSGMRKGVVINPDQVSQRIKEAIGFCQENNGLKTRPVLVNVNGSHLQFLLSRGLVSVSRADQRISEADIDRALQASKTLSLSPNQEILDTIAQEFVIDGQPGIREALGLQGIRLEVKTLCVVLFSPYLKNLGSAALGAGLEIEDIVPSILASSEAVLYPKEKELGVVVVEIGAGTTGLAVFEEGVLCHAAVLPLGGNNITNDIAVVLKTEIETAEEIKKDFSNILRESKKKKFSSKMVSKVIEARAREILLQVLIELKKINKTKLPAGIVLTGNGAKLFKVVDFAKKELKLSCRIGRPHGFIPEVDDPGWACAAGLVINGARDWEENNRLLLSERGIFGKIKKGIKVFIP